MIDYGLFEFAAAPRTGTTWIINAADSVGLGEGFKAHIHVPFETWGKFRVSVVRHPCHWLASYFTTINGGYIHVPAVDKFCSLPKDDFDDFVRAYLHHLPGGVGKMFFAYNADSYLKTEEFPHNFYWLLESLGVEEEKREKCLVIPRQNAISEKKLRPSWNPALWDRVVRSEKPMMEHFEYA